MATVLSLRRLGDFSILLTDAGASIRERAGESAPRDLVAPLRWLQLEEPFFSAGHGTSPGSAVIWGREQVGYNDSLLNPMGPAWRLNRAHFDHMLAAAAVDRGIDVQWNTRYVGAKSSDGLFLSFSRELGQNPMVVHAEWVVDATGPRARFARDLGVKSHIDDHVFGLAAYSRIQSGQITKQVLIEAGADGWWYAACLPDDRMVCMFVTDAAHLRRIKADGAKGWGMMWNGTKLVGPALSGLGLGEPEFQTFPVFSSLLEQTAGNHWLAVGDAASCYDPVVSQGLFKALSDGVVAGRALAKALSGNTHRVEEAYASSVTERYKRYFDQRCMFYEQEQRWPESAFWVGRRKAGQECADHCGRTFPMGCG